MLQFFYRYFLLQVNNLNLATNLENNCFYAMVITCKCTPLYKKLDCDTKNKPPCFATTHEKVKMDLTLNDGMF